MSRSANVCRENYNRTLACLVRMNGVRSGRDDDDELRGVLSTNTALHSNKSVFLCVTREIYVDDKNIKTYARNDSHYV